MSTMNRCEAEIDAIRLQLYEETKDMTIDERSKLINETGQKLAAEFGFKIGKPSSRTDSKKSNIV